MLIDIYTDRNEHVGTEDKKRAHEQGLWHRTFSCLAINPTTATVLLQKKSPGRYVFDRPDHADFTVGGHYHAGETIGEGVRELREELGLDTPYTDLQPLGIRQTAVTLAPAWIEHEFQYWHLLPLNLDLADIPLGDAEVSGLVEVALDDAIALASAQTTQAPARYLIRDDQDGHHQVLDDALHGEDLIPGYLTIDQLYLRMFISARRYLNGERTHLFW